MSVTPTIVRASDLDTCLQRLDKVLTDLDKAEKALGYALNEIEVRKRLETLNTQLFAVKDAIIAEQDKLINRLSKPKSSLQKILKIVERVAMIAAGIMIGRGL